MSNLTGAQAAAGLKPKPVDQLQQTEQPQPLNEIDTFTEMTRRAKHHKKWNRRLKIFFCCLGYKKNKDSIADVASIFAEFYNDLDVPSSDIAAGFVLLSKYQAAQRQWIVKNQQLGIDQYLSSVPITVDSKFLDISTASDSHLINDLIYYMNYSLAIFGWPMQMLDDPCMLCCIYPYLNVLSCSDRKKKGATSKKTDEKKQAKKDKDKTQDKAGDKQVNKVDDKSNNSTATLPQEQSESNNDTTTTSPEGNSGEVLEEESVKREQKRQSVTGKLDDDCDMPVILEDNCCGCNVASVERRLRAHNYEIIYVSYKVNVNVVPFLVAADHSKQTIVVAMRGSMSLSDMITDMNGQIDKLPIDECPDDWLCHRGITRASTYVKSTLMEEHILDRAFNCRPDLGSQEYSLVLCGHSLGAGVAAILGVLLRKQYPTLKAYLYSPPGGILSLPAVEYTKEFATGIILGNDCVPRLGVAQLERLRYQVLLSLKSSQKSPGKILAKALCPSYCFGGNKVEYDPSLSLNLLYGTEGRSFDYNGCKIPFQVQPQVLYVPGRLIHIVKNHSFKSKARRLFNEPIYQAVWNDNIAYDRIMISEGMFYDHLPNHLMHAMKMLFSKTLPFRKESRTSVSSTSCTREVKSTGIDNGLVLPNQAEKFHQPYDEELVEENIKTDQNQVVINDDDEVDNKRDLDINNNSTTDNRAPALNCIEAHKENGDIDVKTSSVEDNKVISMRKESFTRNHEIIESRELEEQNLVDENGNNVTAINRNY